MNTLPGFLILLVSLLAQIYICGELKSYLHKGAIDSSVGEKLIRYSAGLFILSLLPLLWRAFFGWHDDRATSSLMRESFLLSHIWWMGSVGCAMILLGCALFRWLVPFARRRTRTEDVDLDRRDFLCKGVGLAAAAPLVISGYGALVERRRFELEHFSIQVGGLSSSLSQLTIAHLTDIHVGPFMPPEELALYVDAVNRLRPDLIALTGDFVTGGDDEVSPCVATLAKLKARYGVFACLGNHDSYAGVGDELAYLLGENGISTLRNDATTIRIRDTGIEILGIEDLGTGRPDLRRALKAAEKRPGEVKVLLSHRPEIFPVAARQGIDLVLSGHYHGGQVKLFSDPKSLSVARFLTPYAEGLYRLPRGAETEKKGANLFVSRGVGVSGLPIRLNCPPQIAHLILRKA
jgi:uncharacterized protein